jgi:hypothetical protein
MPNDARITKAGQKSAIFFGILLIAYGAMSLISSIKAGWLYFTFRHTTVYGSVAGVVISAFIALGAYFVVTGYRGLQRVEHEA